MQIRPIKAKLSPYDGPMRIGRFHMRSGQRKLNIKSRINGELSLDLDAAVIRDPDVPDIDLDFIPEAREKIKDFAIKKFGNEHVCSVGLWQTYNPKSGLKDVARALGYREKLRELDRLSKELPAEFDEEENVKSAMSNFEPFEKWAQQDEINVQIAYYAFKLSGKIKTQGRHAGGLIISSVPLVEQLPMAQLGGKWTSEWTEGKHVQLSKFGFIKYDILGLKTLQYIWEASSLIKRNHNVTIDWGSIPLDDAEAMKTANTLRTDSIFQFDTDIAKGILAKGGAKSIMDLMVYTSLGRPGPMPMIDVYISRRDDPNLSWKSEEHPKVLELLGETYGICVFQEQLTLLLTKLADFTIPEAERARKIMSKKWADQMKWVMAKMLSGFGRNMPGACDMNREVSDEELVQLNELCGTHEWTWAKEYWKRLETFARYSFNRGHAVSYSLQSFRCLYLKAHYAPEWWCAVLNGCNLDRIPEYIGIARAEGVKFGSLDFNNLSPKFDVINNQIVPGLSGIKKLGVKTIARLNTTYHEYIDIDDFVDRNFSNKTVFERLIKLGAFDAVHPNRKALWMWYIYKYGSSSEYTRSIKKTLHSMCDEETKQLTRKQVFDMFEGNDFTYKENLEFQLEFLGYYWDSPMNVFLHKIENNISNLKLSEEVGVLDCIVHKFDFRKTKNGTRYVSLMITDGSEMARVNIWSDQAAEYDTEEYFSEGTGLRIPAEYNNTYHSFNISGRITKLRCAEDLKKRKGPDGTIYLEDK